MKRAHAYFKGTVQGVGFRLTSVDIARSLGVGGWVMNLSDGRVELVVEGQDELVQKCLQRISDHFAAYLQDRELVWEEPTGKCADFTIRY